MSTNTEHTRVAAIYNPQTQTKTQLIEGFVVRQQIFRNLFKVIKEAKMEVPEQHYLLLGRRGMGKTTLLLRLAYEVENDPKLNPWLIPLVFNEEEYSIRRLFKFWERIMDLLEERHPGFRFEKTEQTRLSIQHKGDDSYERALFEWLAGELERTGRKLLLFVDNFGDMARKLTDEEAHRLRKILQTSPNLRIIAASSVVLEAFYRYDHPFYEFFKVMEIKGLDAKETRGLLLSLSKHYKKEVVARIVEQHPGRVEALRRITSGVPRTMVLLFEIFADDEEGNAFKDLEIVLDRTTPLYKHRMDDLSDQQQAIVEVIALNWDALSVKDIAERTRLESKIISAQLQNLEKNGIIQKIPTKTKNHLYIVAERFFNIWYLMRNGRRGDEKRVLWLVRFFEDWCDGDMMKSRAVLHRAALQRGDFDPEAAFAYTQALAQTQKLSATERHELLRDTRTFLLEKSPALAADLKPSELEEAYAAVELWFEGSENEAVELLEKIQMRVLGKNFLEVISKMTNDSMTSFQREIRVAGFATSLGNSFFKLQQPDWDKSEQCFLWALELTDRNQATLDELYSTFEVKEGVLKEPFVQYGKANKHFRSTLLNHLGAISHKGRKDIEKALEWYRKSAENGNDQGMLNMGVLQLVKENVTEAMIWFGAAAKLKNLKGMIALLSIYFYSKVDKGMAADLASEIIESKDVDVMSLNLSACIFLWANEIERSKKMAPVFLIEEWLSRNNWDWPNTYFTLLLAKNEAQWLLDYFSSPEGEAVQLKDRFKPIWYAILKKLGHPDFLRMGEELAQTVDEILAKAEQMAVEYA